MKSLKQHFTNQGPRYDFENGGGHIREVARFTITLGANKISNLKVNDWEMTRQFITLSDKIFIESHNA